MYDIKKDLLVIVDALIESDQSRLDGNEEPYGHLELAKRIQPSIDRLMSHIIETSGKIDLACFDSSFFDGLTEPQMQTLCQGLIYGASQLAISYVQDMVLRDHPVVKALMEQQKKHDVPFMDEEPPEKPVKNESPKQTKKEAVSRNEMDVSDIIQKRWGSKIE